MSDTNVTDGCTVDCGNKAGIVQEGVEHPAVSMHSNSNSLELDKLEAVNTKTGNPDYVMSGEEHFIRISQDSQGKWRWRLKVCCDSKGKAAVIANSSCGFGSLERAKQNIEDVATALLDVVTSNSK